MDNVRLMLGDCLERLRELPDNSVDSVVTDPPYGLSFMGKKWDYDVPSVDVWRECLRVLKPGGHLLAFAGTRTQHRMAVRIEDAGFEIRDMIAWVYGSGFPKSYNLKDEWQGWGTALKPALEPITVARKPLIGTVAQNVLEHGTGAINVDGCRVGTQG
jgi:site-specific DNA-methyltransferase (adenine-specific)